LEAIGFWYCPCVLVPNSIIKPLRNGYIFYFRYRLFVLQASSLRRNPFIGIACGSKKKGIFEGKHSSNILQDIKLLTPVFL
jgi:hypothetical protein